MGKSSLLQRLGLAPRSAPSIEEFRDQVIDELLRRHPSARFERPDSETVEIHWQGKPEPATYSVRQGYDVLSRNPRDVRPFVTHLADVFQISSYIPTPDLLAVFIEATDYLPDLVPGDPPLKRRVADGLIAVVMVDTVYGSVRPPGSTLRKEFGLDDEGLWEEAMKNTVARLDLEHVPLKAGEPMVLERQDDLAASLLLVDEFWDPPRRKETLVAAPVAPSKLAVTAIDDHNALALMRRMMQLDPASAAWRRFRDLLVRRDGRWEVMR